MSTDKESSAKDEAPNWRLKKWFPSLDESVHENLKKYFNELQNFNKVLNLVSSKTLVHADAVHFSDSILACQLVYDKLNKNKDLYDIGSGNGFPGLIYAVLYPEQSIVLVDSDQRKCEFLRHVMARLGLRRVSIKNTCLKRAGLFLR